MDSGFSTRAKELMHKICCERAMTMVQKNAAIVHTDQQPYISRLFNYSLVIIPSLTAPYSMLTSMILSTSFQSKSNALSDEVAARRAAGVEFD